MQARASMTDRLVAMRAIAASGQPYRITEDLL